VLRAAAAAHRLTGVPITTHTVCPPNGLEQQQVFRQAGVDLSRVVIGHVGRSVIYGVGRPGGDAPALEYIRKLLGNGCYVGFDQFWRPDIGLRLVPNLSPDSEEYRTALRRTQEQGAKALDAIVTLVNEGHADRIVLSNDHCCCHDDAVPPDFYAGFDKAYL